MKKWWTSKTFWLNIATLGVASAMQENSPTQLAQVLAVANVILRFFTHQPIGSGGDDSEA
jgi:hypothetical protein